MYIWLVSGASMDGTTVSQGDFGSGLRRFRARTSSTSKREHEDDEACDAFADYGVQSRVRGCTMM